MWLCRRRLILFRGRVWRRGRGFGCRAVDFRVSLLSRDEYGVEIGGVPCVLRRRLRRLKSSLLSTWLLLEFPRHLDTNISSISIVSIVLRHPFHLSSL